MSLHGHQVGTIISSRNRMTLLRRPTPRTGGVGETVSHHLLGAGLYACDHHTPFSAANGSSSLHRSFKVSSPEPSPTCSRHCRNNHQALWGLNPLCVLRSEVLNSKRLLF